MLKLPILATDLSIDECKIRFIKSTRRNNIIDLWHYHNYWYYDKIYIGEFEDNKSWLAIYSRPIIIGLLYIKL